MSTPWDVVVIGAGPAGCSAAATLGQAGTRVLVLEKDQFPRFHIGESLLPASGMVQEVLKIDPSPDTYLFKRGAQFICEASGRSSNFNFAEALPGPPRHAYHVERSKFDRQLRDRAVELGATVHNGVKVTGIDVGDDSVLVKTESGVERARYVIDATGQDRLLGKAQRSIEPYKHFGKAASFTHFENISSAVVAEFAPHNDIRIMMVEDGWAWVIPLPNNRLSIGLVSRKQGALKQDSVLDYVRGSKLLSRYVEGATVTPSRMIGNFSFRNTKSYGPRFASVGDSACFIDPVFSSGVSLALNGGMSLAKRLITALAEGTEADPELARPTAELIQPAYDSFCSLVYRFYNTRFVDNVLFTSAEPSEMRSAVISVLAGDVFRDGNAFRDMLLSSRLKPWQNTPTNKDSDGTRGSRADV